MLALVDFIGRSAGLVVLAPAFTSSSCPQNLTNHQLEILYHLVPTLQHKRTFQQTPALIPATPPPQLPATPLPCSTPAFSAFPGARGHTGWRRRGTGTGARELQLAGTSRYIDRGRGRGRVRRVRHQAREYGG